MRCGRSGVLLPLLLVALAGCTNVSAGEPRPRETTGSASTEQPSSSSTPSARPREIRLDGVDPCTLLPQADYPDYYLDKPGEPGTDDNGAATCAWFGDVGAMDTDLVTYEGVEAREGRHGTTAPAEPIEGFPTYTGTLPNDEKACFIFVDVAEGQLLDVQLRLYSFPAEVSSACDYAHQFASSIMSTLVKR
jgi:hypothetical protein